MFQRAPPEASGSGVRTSMPSLARSLQFWMPSGLPGRTSKTATDVETIPLSSLADQSLVMRPASTTFCRSGSKDAAKTSAWNPFTMFSACVVEPP